MTRRAALVGLSACSGMMGLAPAGLIAKPLPADTVILTVNSAGNPAKTFTEQSFAALPWHSLVTHTAWTTGAQTFEGVRLRDVLAACGLTQHALAGKTLALVALNDYRIDIPASDAFDYDTLVARKQNGTEMLRRDKGPLWLVYPRDDVPALTDLRFDHRWAWQLATITVQ